ncbi:hypothetical protein AN640_02745 [Candidatus Epulonipiscium fishelsonii]|uniref:Uncharacterized protein n=1 Tax=Candidatus Epulonipiscium fishelsonii TaxID=77094 RepID=A0ACC8X8K3_9FIRM|nr:hypothetical protein AN640_02745 [Epulopiscium sp. SCG-D08WGA-EpuloA1]
MFKWLKSLFRSNSEDNEEDEIQENNDGGFIFENSMKSCDFQGNGKLYDKKKFLIYEGDFKDGKPHGKGVAYIGDEVYIVANYKGDRTGV